MENYEINIQENTDITKIKKQFDENGFLHLKGILNPDILNEIKQKVLNEFDTLDNTDNLSASDLSTLNRSEMPVIHNKCPRLDINTFNAVIRSRLPEVLEKIHNNSFLWHYPPQIRRLTTDNNKGLLPYHQDYYYSKYYENIVVCWTPLVDCGEDAPSIELIRKTLTEKLEHGSNETWEFGIPSEIVQKYMSKNDVISLKNVKVGDVVIFDTLNLHRTYWHENMSKTRYSIDFRTVNTNLLSENLLSTRKFVKSHELELVGNINE